MHGDGLARLVLCHDAVDVEPLAIGVQCLVQEAGIEVGVGRTLEPKLS